MVEASDEGYPEARTDQATLTIAVQRDVEIPAFTQESYRATVSENLPINASVAAVRAELSLLVVRISTDSRWSFHSVSV